MEKDKKKQSLTIALVAGLIMILTVALGALIFYLVEGNPLEKAKPPKDSLAFTDRYYEDVEDLFEEAGFTNIHAEGLEDLKESEVSKEGTVASVAIGGETDFGEKDYFEKDTKVMIRFHSLNLKPDPKPVVKPEEEKPDNKPDTQKPQSGETEKPDGETKPDKKPGVEGLLDTSKVGRITFDGTAERVDFLENGKYNVLFSRGKGILGKLYIAKNVTLEQMGCENVIDLVGKPVRVTGQMKGIDKDTVKIILVPENVEILNK